MTTETNNQNTTLEVSRHKRRRSEDEENPLEENKNMLAYLLRIPRTPNQELKPQIKISEKDKPKITKKTPNVTRVVKANGRTNSEILNSIKQAIDIKKTDIEVNNIRKTNGDLLMMAK